jgi:hypothetical protein
VSPPRFDALADRYEAHRTGYSDELSEALLALAPEEPLVLDAIEDRLRAEIGEELAVNDDQHLHVLVPA